ncbi:MAG: hypothetical protein M1482_14345 [Chloroflexi bacterium]|nr:hypothetical protein [Chloroflexota bacterium]
MPLVVLGFLAALSLIGVGCSVLPFSSATPPPNTLAYDAPVSLVVKNGALLPGTSLAYSGKTETGAGKMMITGLAAPKQVGDAVDWNGTPVPDVDVRLSTRVASFDDQSITLIGTSHVEIKKITVQPGGAGGTALMEFNAPVSFSLNKDESIPGTNLIYGGSTADGAKFVGLDGYPYRKSLDSLQYVGRVNPKVFLKLDLRVLTFSESNVVLGGTADVKIESQQ